jgi:membrane associated rhomboid family serine protease
MTTAHHPWTQAVGHGLFVPVQRRVTQDTRDARLAFYAHIGGFPFGVIVASGLVRPRSLVRRRSVVPDF